MGAPGGPSLTPPGGTGDVDPILSVDDMGFTGYSINEYEEVGVAQAGVAQGEKYGAENRDRKLRHNRILLKFRCVTEKISVRFSTLPAIPIIDGPPLRQIASHCRCSQTAPTAFL